MTNAGSILNHAAHNSRSRFAEVRELVSSAIERISPIGLRVNIATESTACVDAIAMRGTMKYSSRSPSV